MPNYIKNIRKHIGNAPMILSVAGVILLDEKNRILLQERTDDGTWCLPGGAMELGETWEEAAKREVFEETGLIVDEMKLFNVYSGKEQHNVYPNGDEVYYASVVFISRKFHGDMHVDAIESKNLKFFELNELPDPLNIPTKPVLDDLRRQLG